MDEALPPFFHTSSLGYDFLVWYLEFTLIINLSACLDGRVTSDHV